MGDLFFSLSFLGESANGLNGVDLTIPIAGKILDVPNKLPFGSMVCFDTSIQVLSRSVSDGFSRCRSSERVALTISSMN